MAKRRRKMTAKQRKYFGKKKERTVAKKRRRKSSRRAAPRRRSHSAPRRRRRHGGGGGGRSYGIMPNRHEVENYAAMAGYGFLEAQAVKDPAFLLNKIPRPVAQLGYAGGTALALRVVNSLFVRNKYVGLLANAAAMAAMYQFGRLGALPTSAAAPATVSGDDDMGDDLGDYLDDEVAGELEGEADGLDGDDAVSAMVPALGSQMGASGTTVEAMEARKGQLGGLDFLGGDE